VLDKGIGDTLRITGSAFRIVGIYQTGDVFEDSGAILDLSEAHILALGALDDHPSLICNLGNGEGYSVKEVIRTACEVTGHDILAVVGPRRPGDGPTLVADASRARKVLGWEPRIPDLHDIVASAWAWHQSHPHGYDSE